jgi:hypothetical protein
MGDFFDCFFEQGWAYFYKFCLSMLGIFKDKLLEEDEFAGILSHIKFKTPDKNNTQGSDPDDIAFNSSNKSSNSPSYHFVFDEKT